MFLLLAGDTVARSNRVHCKDLEAGTSIGLKSNDSSDLCGRKKSLFLQLLVTILGGVIFHIDLPSGVDPREPAADAGTKRPANGPECV